MSELFPSAVTDTIGNTGVDGGTLKTVAGAAAGISLAVKAVVSVGEEEMGIRRRFKKARVYKRGRKQGRHKIVGPGPHLTFPGVHSIVTINVNDRSTDLEDLILDVPTGKDGIPEQYKIGSSAVWRVSKEGEAPYDAYFGTSTLQETVTNICVNGLLATCRNIGNPNELYDSELIFNQTHERCEDDLMNYGVVLVNLYLTSVARTEAQVLASAISESPTNANNVLVMANASGVVVPGNGNGHRHGALMNAG
jgi:hypothetical protein